MTVKWQIDAASGGQARSIREREKRGRGWLTPALFAAGIVLVFASGCSADSGVGAELTVKADDNNSLIAVVEVTTDEPVDLVVEVSSDETDSRTVASAGQGQEHVVTVVGLRAETSYSFRVLADNVVVGSTIEHTTGSLPEGAPSVEILDGLERDESPAAGITMFGLSSAGRNGTENVGPAYWGVDADGEVVWYLDPENEAAQDPVIRDLGNGEVLVFSDSSLDRMTLGGDLISSFDVSSVRTWHHDAALMPDGGVLLLGRENREVDGVDVRGDTVIRLDATGSTVFTWSSFDHLDTARTPGELAASEARAGGRDWTHANSVFLDSDRNEILVSLRSQNWIVAIDADNGDLKWIAGDDAGTSDDLDVNFIELMSGTWPSGQHAALRTPEGNLVVYDNRNETGGDENNSRGVVYAIDDVTGSASQVTEVVAPKFTASLGDIDVLAAGNLLITAGGPGSDDTAYLIEANADGSTVWSAAIDGRIYRSERITWETIDSAAATATMAAAATGEPTEVAAGNDTAADADEVNANAGNRTGQRAGNGTGQRAGNGNRQQNRTGNGGGNGGTTVAPPSADDLVNPVDLTNSLLSETAGSCDEYVGQYTSTVDDTSNGNVFNGALIISSDAETCTIESNSIPNHDISVDTNFANETGEVATRFEIPVDPQAANEPTVLDLDPHAVMLNGVIWEAFPAACFDAGNNNLGSEAIGCGPDQLDHPWRYNVGSDLNVFRLDAYFAHSQGDGLYHYHRTPQALYTIECDGNEKSPVIGFARDGFPIYGPCFTDADDVIRSAQSSFELKSGSREEVDGYLTPYAVGRVASDEYNGQFLNDYQFVDGVGDLDECNGMTVDGQYGYYLTGDYPYVLSCFTGTPSEVWGRAS